MTKNHVLGLLFLTILLVQGSYFTRYDVPLLSLNTLIGAVVPALIVAETNDIRRAEGANDLIYNTVLHESAQAKAEDMVRKQYFAHTSPDGVAPWEWFKGAGYIYLYAGENLAVHYDESADVVRAWMQSKTHRETMLAGKYTEIGIGVAEGYFEGQNTVFVVEHFGTPLQQPIADTIEVYSGVRDARVLAAAGVVSSGGSPVGALPFATFGLTTFAGLFYTSRAFIHAWKREHAQHLMYASFILIFIGITYTATLFL